MNRKKLINEYILRNMIGKTIRIIKVLYFDSKVWYVAQNIQTPTHLYMCYFGHTKPSALAIERNLCDNSNQEVIEMIDAITIDDLPSTVVDIEDAIDDEDLSLNISDINRYLSFTTFTVDTLLKELSTLLIENSMFDSALDIFFDFDSLNGLEFADSYMIPTIVETVKEILKDIDDTILSTYVDSLLAVKNSF